MHKLYGYVYLLPRNTAVLYMHLYRKLISPLYGEVCRYHPSCSKYALESFKYQGLIKGTFLTVWRLLRCNPWSSGGIDDPLPSKRIRLIENKYGFVSLGGIKETDNINESGNK